MLVSIVRCFEMVVRFILKGVVIFVIVMLFLSNMFRMVCCVGLVRVVKMVFKGGLVMVISFV